MSQEYSPVVIRVVRYGLPCIILIYYVTASLSFPYTPDSTYLFLQATHGVQWHHFPASSPSPLWQLLVAAGHLLGLDAVLTVKVFSLFFCSFAVLSAYLFAAELMLDRIGALFVALSVATEPWLIQLGPSGSGMGLGVVLSLGTLFFMMRREYPLAGVCAGLCTLVFWEGIGLLLVVLTDLIVQSAPIALRVRKMGAAFLSFTVVIVPWLVYAGMHTVPSPPALVPFGEFPPASVWEAVAGVVLIGLIVAGMVAWSTPAGGLGVLVRSNAAALLWVLWLAAVAVVTGLEITFLVCPVIVAYAFYGLKLLLAVMQRERLLYTVGLLLSVVLLVGHQMVFNRMTRPVMNGSIRESGILMTAGLWVRGNADGKAVIAADRPGIIGFYSARNTESLHDSAGLHADFVVTSVDDIEGYEKVYAPYQEDTPVGGLVQSPIAVWKRR